MEEYGNKDLTARKTLLQYNDLNQGSNFLKKWEKVSGFGQKILLNLFEDGYQSRKSMNKKINQDQRLHSSFRKKIGYPLKEKKGRLFFTNSTVSSLKSLFNEYISLREEFEKNLLTTLTETSTTKKNTEHKAALTETLAKEQEIIQTEIKKLYTIHNNIYEKFHNLSIEISILGQSLEGIEYPEDTDIGTKIQELSKEIKGLENKMHSISVEIEKLETLLKGIK